MSSPTVPDPDHPLVDPGPLSRLDPQHFLIQSLLQCLRVALEQLEQHAKLLEELSKKWLATKTRAEANPFDSVKRELAELMGRIDDYVRSGKLRELTSEVTKVLGDVGSFILRLMDLYTRYGDPTKRR